MSRPFGYKITEETRKKLSIQKMGNKNPNYNKVSKSCFQKNHIPWNKGLTGIIKWTDEQRKKQSELKKKLINEGKHNFYIDGRSNMRNKKDNSLEWRLWREKIFKRDNFTCQMCGDMGVYLEPHHILKKNKYPELIFELNNGITLCRPCHQETMGKEEDFEELFTQHLNMSMAYC